MSRSSKLHTKQAMAARLRRLEDQLQAKQRQIAALEAKVRKAEPSPFVKSVIVQVEREAERYGAGDTYGIKLMFSPSLFARSMWHNSTGDMRDLDYGVYRIAEEMSHHVAKVLTKAVRGDLTRSD